MNLIEAKQYLEELKRDNIFVSIINKTHDRHHAINKIQEVLEEILDARYSAGLLDLDIKLEVMHP